MEYLCTFDPDNYFTVHTIKGSRSFIDDIYGVNKAEWTGHCLLIDLIAETQKNVIYRCIGYTKDAWFSTAKYGDIRLKKFPHAVVFADFLPKTKMLSEDRWDIREMERDKNNVISIKKINCEEVKKIRKISRYNNPICDYKEDNNNNSS